MSNPFAALLGNETVKQILIWNVASQLIEPILAPVLAEVEKGINKLEPTAILSPADLAAAVVRNFKDQASAADMASQSGISADLFQVLIDLAADAPAPEELAEALRRSLIPETGTGPDSISFEQGIAEGRLADKWAPVIKGLSQEWPTPTDALQAYLEGQIDEATAQQLYQLFGGDPDYFTLLYNTRGNAPSPEQALEMARRGIIPWTGTGADVTSFQQAFLEGPWRNKWEPAFEALQTTLPSAYYVKELLAANALSVEDATTILTQEGYAPNVVQAWITSAKSPTTSTAKTLTESTVVDLYTDQLISQTEAASMLESLGYSAADAESLMQLASYKVSASQLNQAIGRVRALYTAGKLTKTGANDALTTLHVPAAQITALFDLWDVESGLNVVTLSASELASAVYYGTMDQATAMTRLQALGYDEYDAWQLLSIRAHAPLPNPPPGWVNPAPATTT